MPNRPKCSLHSINFRDFLDFWHSTAAIPFQLHYNGPTITMISLSSSILSFHILQSFLNSGRYFLFFSDILFAFPPFSAFECSTYGGTCSNICYPTSSSSSRRKWNIQHKNISSLFCLKCTLSWLARALTLGSYPKSQCSSTSFFLDLVISVDVDWIERVGSAGWDAIDGSMWNGSGSAIVGGR